METGDLRHRVQIQSFSEKQDETTGDIGGTWETVAYRWASIEPIRGKEFFGAQQVQSDVTHRIRMRAFTGLNNKHRILFRNRHFNIGSILNVDERDRELELMCTEKTRIATSAGGAAGPILGIE